MTRRPLHRALYNAAADAVTLAAIVTLSVGAALWYWGRPRGDR